MTLHNISRLLVGFAAVLLGAVGVGIWLAPDQAAHLLGLEAVRASGLAVVRADIGGLYVGWLASAVPRCGLDVCGFRGGPGKRLSLA